MSRWLWSGTAAIRAVPAGQRGVPDKGWHAVPSPASRPPGETARPADAPRRWIGGTGQLRRWPRAVRQLPTRLRPGRGPASPPRPASARRRRANPSPRDRARSPVQDRPARAAGCTMAPPSNADCRASRPPSPARQAPRAGRRAICCARRSDPATANVPPAPRPGQHPAPRLRAPDRHASRRPAALLPWRDCRRADRNSWRAGCRVPDLGAGCRMPARVPPSPSPTGRAPAPAHRSAPRRHWPPRVPAAPAHTPAATAPAGRADRSHPSVLLSIRKLTGPSSTGRVRSASAAASRNCASGRLSVSTKRWSRVRRGTR